MGGVGVRYPSGCWRVTVMVVVVVVVVVAAVAVE